MKIVTYSLNLRVIVKEVMAMIAYKSSVVYIEVYPCTEHPSGMYWKAN